MYRWHWKRSIVSELSTATSLKGILYLDYLKLLFLIPRHAHALVVKSQERKVEMFDGTFHRDDWASCYILDV